MENFFHAQQVFLFHRGCADAMELRQTTALHRAALHAQGRTGRGAD